MSKKAYIIIYHLIDTDESYVEKVIKSYRTWWHYINDFWIVITADTAGEISSKIKPVLDDDERLLVVEMGRDRQGWLPKDAWEWLDKNFPKKEVPIVAPVVSPPSPARLTDGLREWDA